MAAFYLLPFAFCTNSLPSPRPRHIQIIKDLDRVAVGHTCDIVNHSASDRLAPLLVDTQQLFRQRVGMRHKIAIKRLDQKTYLAIVFLGATCEINPLE